MGFVSDYGVLIIMNHDATGPNRETRQIVLILRENNVEIQYKFFWLERLLERNALEEET